MLVGLVAVTRFMSTEQQVVFLLLVLHLLEPAHLVTLEVVDKLLLVVLVFLVEAVG
jgi:hypothetical protein